MHQWETKIGAIINETKRENVTSLVFPSWMVLLNKMLTEVGKENLFDIWPNLEVYFHGGVNFDTNNTKAYS
jgi:hypothetical protein